MVPFYVCILYLYVHWIGQNKKERKKVREVGLLKKDPDQIKDQIQKLETMSKFILC